MNFSVTKLAFSNVFRFKRFLLQSKLNAICKFKSSETTNEFSLSELDKEIIRLHKEAVNNNKIFYEDPVTGLLVSTEVKHFKRQRCCGSGCRHCPYNHSAVKDEKLRKKFNGFFYF